MTTKTNTKVRKSIFEILEEKYDFNKEFKKISNLFHCNMVHINMYGYPIEMFVNNVFYKWKGRGSCVNCGDMRTELDIDTILKLQEPSQNDITLCLEYYSNILHVFLTKWAPGADSNCISKDIEILKTNIDLLIDRMNLTKQIIEDEEKVILVPKDPAAIAVAETAQKDIAFAILKYNHISLQGQLEEKRRLLQSIANEYEHLLQKPIDGFSEFFKTTNGLLNNLNIRHNNKKGKNQKDMVKNMSSEELENNYDELYQLLLFCILIKDNTERKKLADELLRKIKETPKEQTDPS